MPQLADGAVSKIANCGFESHPGYHLIGGSMKRSHGLIGVALFIVILSVVLITIDNASKSSEELPTWETMHIGDHADDTQFSASRTKKEKVRETTTTVSITPRGIEVETKEAKIDDEKDDSKLDYRSHAEFAAQYDHSFQIDDRFSIIYTQFKSGNKNRCLDIYFTVYYDTDENGNITKAEVKAHRHKYAHRVFSPPFKGWTGHE